MVTFEMSTCTEPTPLTPAQQCGDCAWNDSGYCTAFGRNREFPIAKTFGCRAWTMMFPQLDGTDEGIVALMQEFVEENYEMDGTMTESISSLLLERVQQDAPEWTLEQLRLRCNDSPLLEMRLQLSSDWEMLSGPSMAGPAEWQHAVHVWALPTTSVVDEVLLDECVDETPDITAGLLAVARRARQQ